MKALGIITSKLFTGTKDKELLIHFLKAVVRQEYHVRIIDVPLDKNLENMREDETAEMFFKYGQNELQKRDCRSLSIGDCILHNDEIFIVNFVGFEKLTEFFKEFITDEITAQIPESILSIQY